MTTNKFLIALVILTLMSCNRKSKVVYSYQLSNNRDTINIIDHAGLRQGIWLMPNSKDTMVFLNDTGYSTKTSSVDEIIKMLNTSKGAALDSVKKQAINLRVGYYE